MDSSIGTSIETGTKVSLTRPIRSAKTGMLLPREAILVSISENLGRVLLLVEFANGQREYVFDYEVNGTNGHASPQHCSSETCIN